jgi:hypothetical protein
LCQQIGEEDGIDCLVSVLQVQLLYARMAYYWVGFGLRMLFVYDYLGLKVHSASNLFIGVEWLGRVQVMARLW